MEPVQRFEAAEREARERVDRQPDQSEAWFQLGDALRALWRMADAESAFLRATTIDPAHAPAWAGLGFVQIVRGKPDEGLASCRRASRLRPDLAAPHRHIALLLLGAGRIDEAARSATEARRLDPASAEGLSQLGVIWFHAGLRAGGRRLIDRVISSHQDAAEAFVNRALVALSDPTTIEAADQDLDRALAIKPWLAPAYALRAQLRRKQGRLPEALEAIAAARHHLPESEDYLVVEIGLLEEMGRGADALALAETALETRRASRALRMRLAMLLLDAGQVDRALRHIPGVLPQATPVVAWKTLADTWRALGREPDRGRCLDRAVDAGGDNATRLALGESLQRLGEREAALTAIAPIDGDLAVHLLRAEVLVQLDRQDEALAALDAALALSPDDALAHMRMGILRRRRKEFDEAERFLRRAVELRPTEAAVHEQLAILLSEQERLDDALVSLQRAAEIAPATRSVRFNMAVVLARQKRWAEAERGLREAVAANPLHLSALGNLGRVLSEQQRHEEAAELFESLIELTPFDLGVRYGLVGALQNLRRHDEVARAARAWVSEAPDDPHAWRTLATALATLNDPGAEAASQRVAELAPHSVLSYETSGLVAIALRRPKEAIEWFDKGLALAPRQVSLMVNRALALDEVEGLDAAARELERAVEIEPDSHAARMNLSLVQLRLGRFEVGWRAYESRNSAIRGPKALPQLKVEGARPDLSASSVLVRAEQGLGDTIHFMRYIPRLAAETREVIFQLQDQIAWMAWGMAPNVRVCGYRDPVPHADYHVSLISLPGYYDTDLDSIPAGVPYMTADPRRVATWRGRLGEAGFKVGVVWHTNPAHGNTKRWISLDYLAPLAGIDGVRLISLQKQFGLDQLEAVRTRTPIETLEGPFDEGPDAFADTAAVVANLDLVITIDTSMGHLAGALGRPVWVLLPRSSDWRWLTNREDNPWYPTLRLFQQTVSDDWTSVAAQVKDRLTAVRSGQSPVIWPVGSSNTP